MKNMKPKLEKAHQTKSKQKRQKKYDYPQGFANDFYYVSKIISERTLPNGRIQLFVQWEGWPTEYNSWVYKQTLMPIDEMIKTIDGASIYQSQINIKQKDKATYQKINNEKTEAELNQRSMVKYESENYCQSSSRPYDKDYCSNTNRIKERIKIKNKMNKKFAIQVDQNESIEESKHMSEKMNRYIDDEATHTGNDEQSKLHQPGKQQHWKNKINKQAIKKLKAKKDIKQAKKIRSKKLKQTDISNQSDLQNSVGKNPRKKQMTTKQIQSFIKRIKLNIDKMNKDESKNNKQISLNKFDQKVRQQNKFPKQKNISRQKERIDKEIKGKQRQVSSQVHEQPTPVNDTKCKKQLPKLSCVYSNSITDNDEKYIVNIDDVSHLGQLSNISFDSFLGITTTNNNKYKNQPEHKKNDKKVQNKKKAIKQKETLKQKNSMKPHPDNEKDKNKADKKNEASLPIEQPNKNTNSELISSSKMSNNQQQPRSIAKHNHNEQYLIVDQIQMYAQQPSIKPSQIETQLSIGTQQSVSMQKMQKQKDSQEQLKVLGEVRRQNPQSIQKQQQSQSQSQYSQQQYQQPQQQHGQEQIYSKMLQGSSQTAIVNSKQHAEREDGFYDELYNKLYNNIKQSGTNFDQIGNKNKRNPSININAIKSAHRDISGKQGDQQEKNERIAKFNDGDGNGKNRALNKSAIMQNLMKNLYKNDGSLQLSRNIPIHLSNKISIVKQRNEKSRLNDSKCMISNNEESGILNKNLKDQQSQLQSQEDDHEWTSQQNQNDILFQKSMLTENKCQGFELKGKKQRIGSNVKMNMIKAVREQNLHNSAIQYTNEERQKYKGRKRANETVESTNHIDHSSIF